jgi:hypothetical protein
MPAQDAGDQGSAGTEKSGSSHGAMRLEPPVMTGTERNNLRKSYRAFPFPTAAFLSLLCYRHVTLLWRLDGSIFRKSGYRFSAENATDQEAGAFSGKCLPRT